MNHFCTYCDSGYAARLLCLHQSLCVRGEPFVLFVLCFDATVATVIEAEKHPSLVPIALSEVLRDDPEFAAVRSTRSKVEFYFTATPVIVRHCFHRAPDAARMTYLDSDLFFFGPASAVFAEQGDASVGIVSHRFPQRLKPLEKNGIYNVAWVSFRRDADGMACLAWWRERCLEWCHDVVDQGRYADQGYLDEFPRRFARVRVLDHPGINAAPWNLDDMSFEQRDGLVFINGQPLLFYHFQGLRELLRDWYDPGLLLYSSPMTSGLREFVYRPYLKMLAAFQERLEREHQIAPSRGYHRLSSENTWRARWKRLAIRRMLPVYRLLRGQLLHCPSSAAAPAASR